MTMTPQPGADDSASSIPDPDHQLRLATVLMAALALLYAVEVIFAGQQLIRVVREVQFWGPASRYSVIFEAAAFLTQAAYLALAIASALALRRGPRGIYFALGVIVTRLGYFGFAIIAVAIEIVSGSTSLSVSEKLRTSLPSLLITIVSIVAIRQLFMLARVKPGSDTAALDVDAPIHP